MLLRVVRSAAVVSSFAVGKLLSKGCGEIVPTALKYGGLQSGSGAAFSGLDATFWR